MAGRELAGYGVENYTSKRKFEFFDGNDIQGMNRKRIKEM